MKFRLDMISKKSGMDGYYERNFKQVGWSESQVFELSPEEVFNIDVKNITTIVHRDRSLLVYKEDLIPIEFKPLKDWM